MLISSKVCLIFDALIALTSASIASSVSPILSAGSPTLLGTGQGACTQHASPRVLGTAVEPAECAALGLATHDTAGERIATSTAAIDRREAIVAHEQAKAQMVSLAHFEGGDLRKGIQSQMP